TVVAMIPLWNAGAGLFRGLAVTTIIGVTAGVFLTRPAFASIIEKIYRQ
ncbi:protein translocase subunit SecD, partial [archaeon]|nr:protein translocase subunit SecD [archaeon]